MLLFPHLGYGSLAGHGWIDKDGWLSELDVCEWEMVEACNGVDMITDLLMNSNNLIGRIPVEITHIRMIGKSFSVFSIDPACLSAHPSALYLCATFAFQKLSI